MNEEPVSNAKPRLLTIREHLAAKGTKEPLTSLSQFISRIHEISVRWEQEDWRDRETDELDVLNPVRIVGQVWFRGQRSATHGLRPGLYRESIWKYLRKNQGSPQPSKNEFDENLFQELFNLEHELRIDFTSFGHLLNQANHANEDTDWYFLMQHHGLPTRLLDWTTNALAALFFAAERYREDVEHLNTSKGPLSPTICVWMMDAYWLADCLSSEWRSPILAWSEDATRYIPPLKSLADKMDDSQALLPVHAMPIEPPAMHPRVASQEGRFVIFGKVQDLLDEKIRLEQLEDCRGMEELRLEQITMNVADVDDLMQDLAQLGISRRTLFPDLAGLADFISWKHFHNMRNRKL
jgi:FRG domain